VHNIFEGLAQYHCRYVLGIDSPDPEPAVGVTVDPDQLASATKAFAKKANSPYFGAVFHSHPENFMLEQ
jgi:hypothetical protein